MAGRGGGVRGVVAVALAAAVIAGSARGRASPQEVLGFGFRSLAMGGTGAALGVGVDAVYQNPALLSLSRQNALQLGIQGASFALSAEGAGLPALPAYGALYANTLGGVLPLPFGGLLKDRVAVGLGFLTPFDVVVRGRILYPEKPQFLFADRVQSVAVQAAVGVDVGYGVRIGGGVGALAALTGSVLVATDASGRIGTVVEDTLVASYAPLAGASVDLFDAYRLGLAFRGELVGRFNVVIRADDLGQLKIPPLNISGVAQYDPWQLALEIARVRGPWRLALGATYKHWPAYPGAAEATVRCEDAEPPDPECAAPAPPDPGYAPVVAPRAGVERDLDLAPQVALSLRAGYAFEPSPAPEQRGRANHFDNHRHVLSLGYGVTLPRPLRWLRFDGFAQLQLLQPRSHGKQVASGAERDGTVETGGHVLAGGSSATVRF